MVHRQTLLLVTSRRFGPQRIMQCRTLNQDPSCFAEVSNQLASHKDSLNIFEIRFWLGRHSRLMLLSMNYAEQSV